MTDGGGEEAGPRTSLGPACYSVGYYRTRSNHVAASMARSPWSVAPSAFGVVDVRSSVSRGANVVSWKAMSIGLTQRSRMVVPLCHWDPSTGGHVESFESGTILSNEVPPALDTVERVFQFHR